MKRPTNLRRFKEKEKPCPCACDCVRFRMRVSACSSDSACTRLLVSSRPAHSCVYRPLKGRQKDFILENLLRCLKRSRKFDIFFNTRGIEKARYDAKKNPMEKKFQRPYRPTNRLIAPNQRFISCSVSRLVCIHFFL